MTELLITKKHTAIIIYTKLPNRKFWKIVFGKDKKTVLPKLYLTFSDARDAARTLGFGYYYKIETTYDLYTLTHTNSFRRLIKENLQFFYSPVPLAVERDWRSIYIENGV